MKQRQQQKFIDYAANLKKTVVNQRALIYWCLTIASIQSIVIVYLATHQSLFLIPYGMSQHTHIAVHQITPSYVSQLALSDAATYFNIDGNNVTEQDAIFLSRVLPEARQSLVAQLNKRADYFQENNVSQQFYPYKRSVKHGNSQVTLEGDLIRWMSGKKLFRRAIQLKINYQSLNGYLSISHWSYQHV